MEESAQLDKIKKVYLKSEALSIVKAVTMFLRGNNSICY